MTIEFNMITTRGGDRGKSSLLGGERRLKSDPVFAILGDLDELASCLGLCRTALRAAAILAKPSQLDTKATAMATEIRTIQQELQNISALIATPVSSLNTIKTLGRTDTEWTRYLGQQLEALEQMESRYLEHIELSGFIIPGDNEISARLDVARTVCRRLERGMVTYVQGLLTDYYRLTQNYLNRLSDCLFVMARYVDQNLYNLPQ